RRATVPLEPRRPGSRRLRAPENSRLRRVRRRRAEPGSDRRRGPALSDLRNACPPRQPVTLLQDVCLLLLPLLLLLLLAFGLLHDREVQLALVVLLHVEYLVIEERSGLVVEENPGSTLGAEHLVLLFGSGDHGECELGFLLALLLHREAQSSAFLLRRQSRDRFGGCVRQGKHVLPFRCSRRLRFTPPHRRWVGYAPANSGCFL